jgi:hypothetical protein
MQTKTEKEQKTRWKQMLNYSSVVKQLPFFLFLTALAVVYIYNGHLADKTIRKIIRSENELKDLQNEYKSVKGDALLHSRQSELVDAVKPLGLVELKEEPYVLIDSSELTN